MLAWEKRRKILNASEHKDAMSLKDKGNGGNL